MIVILYKHLEVRHDAHLAAFMFESLQYDTYSGE